MIDPIGLQAVKDEKNGKSYAYVASVAQLRKCVMKFMNTQVITPNVGIRDFQIKGTALKGTQEQILSSL